MQIKSLIIFKILDLGKLVAKLRRAARKRCAKTEPVGKAGSRYKNPDSF